ncbi:AF4/FMR2 family member 1 isoform X1 [Osmerus mordax]|uniref:AF4/FMR2 family member 1 isoform X1 n=1 Tax=Osmerus mordax TaxID=8014 RepID=UPI00350EBD01
MRRTMASQSSLYNEERNLLRIREWERRNQESLQEKEFSQENVPLFGEPYKTNKGDELSSRIQRMLGSYEDVNNPHPCLDSFTKDPSSSSHVMFGRSSHGRPAHTDKAKPPFQSQNPSQYGSGLSGSSSSSGNPSSSHSPQSLKKLPVPEPYGPSPRYSQSSLGHGQGSLPNPHPRKGEAWVDLRECTSLPPVLSAFSPPAEPLSPLHSSDPSDSEPQDTDDKDTPERHQGFPGHPESPGSAMKLSPLDPQRDAAPPPPQANKGTVLPSQTFPPPLASKPPNLVMPPKPTAYVRPMDGQDQVVNESPDLKTSPESFHSQPYEPLPELKTSKPSLSKLKIPSQSIETLSNEVHCVEDILKEMTHSWPPLLTAIHTPSTAEPSKFSFPAKEAQHVPPAYPGQKPYGSPPTASQQSSSCTGAAAHSSGVESASSSDSESSSGSESDSESSEGEEAPLPLGGSSPAVKAEGPMVTNWQLNNWIRVSQQNPSTESQGEAPLHSPTPKQPPGHEVEEEGVAAANHSLEFSDNQAKPQREGTHNNQHGRHKPPPAAVAASSSSSSSSSHNPSSQRKTVGNKHPSKPAKSSRPDDPRPQAGLRVESVEVAPRDKDPSFTDRPKVKTKMGHGKSSAGKTDAKKSAKRSSSDKRKAEAASQGPKVTLAPNCKREADRGPSPSPRPRPSPAPVEQPSPAPAPAPASAPNLAQIAKTSSRVRTETVPQNGQKKPPGPPPPSSPALQPSSKLGPSAKASGPPQFPSKALLVKIELSLINRVPQLSKPSQEGQDKARRKRPPPERRDVNNAAPIATKVSRKRPAGSEIKTQPKKRPKLEKEVKIPPSSSAAAAAAAHTSVKSVAHGAPGAAKEKKKAKKASPQQPPTPQDPGKVPGQKRPAEEGPSTAPNTKNPPAKHKKSSGKRTEHSKTGKKAPKTSFVVPATTSLNGRPLLKFEERQYPVEHHMKEAKKLKHKADDTSDKVSKAFNYLDAAMSFVESGIAMETDPQTPKSAYTMFAETLDLIRFIMKLKNSMDPSAPSTERDFTVLCMKGQSLLQMAMFRYKREVALKYSRTLTDHFKSSSKTAQAPSPCISKGTGAPSPMSPMPSPASASSSGPGSNHSGGAAGAASNTVSIPQVIQQVACSYVNITALFLNAHDAWEQAQELAPRGSGVLSELDSALGPLSLTSSMASLVRYTRQGLHWLRLDTRGMQ